MAVEPYPNGELLAEPARLADGIDRLTILDARPRDAYDAGHIPGAVRVPYAEWEKAFYEGEGQDQQAWRRRIEALGVTADAPVVVYDDNRSKDAARVWWILRYFGARDVRLLNGGWKGWSAGGFPISKDAPAVEPSQFRPAPASARLRDLSTTLSGIRNGSGIQIVDARSNDEHCGIELLNNARGGSIPGAKHLQWSDLLDNETARFKSAEEIRRLFAEAGIDPKKPTVTHCQSGGRASVMAFGLELMGGRDVANYYRGWSEWGNTSQTPIESRGGKGSPSD